MSLPQFTIFQILSTLILWLVFYMKDGAAVSGLDSLSPGWSLLKLNDSCVSYRGEIWRWLLYQFSHGPPSHIAMNVAYVLILGLPLEGFHGTSRMFIMFNVGILGGAFSWMVFNPHVPVVGMSGGCYSLLGMHLADLVMNWAENPNRKKKLTFLLTLATLDVLNGLSTISSHTSHAAHSGGYLAGLMIGIVYGRNLRVTESERQFSKLTLIFGLLLSICCIAWGMWDRAPMSVQEQVRYCWAGMIYNTTEFGDRDWHCVRCHSDECVARWAQAEPDQFTSVQDSPRLCSRVGWDRTEDGR
jgi:membrane associated rhomboid family serine protease